MNNDIKVGFCVAYDWHLLEFALPLVYDHATSICLSMDKDNVSWANESFFMDEDGFQKLIQRIDRDKKIRLLREDFHLPQLSPKENEVRQRNQMANFMGPGGWHLQLDCDEYFLDFKGFVDFLGRLRVRPSKKVNVCCSFITLYKQSGEGFFFVDPLTKKNLEFIQIASLLPAYEYGRRNGYFNLYTDYEIIHQSWARTDQEVKQKLKSWGHTSDFDHGHFYQQWSEVQTGNYRDLRNLHPINPSLWPALKYLPGSDIPKFIDNFKKEEFVSYSPMELKFKNSRILSKLKSYFLSRP